MAAARLALCCWSIAAAGCAAETRVGFFENTDAVTPDATTPDAVPPDDAAAGSRLVLRYDFDGTGTTVLDRAGTADGSIRGGAQLDGAGGLVLDGEDDYVDLPNGLISRLRSGTFLVWVTWHGRNICWQRVFDFGNTVQGEGVVGDALSNVFVTPLDCPGPTGLAMFGNRFNGANTEVLIQAQGFRSGEEQQIALVVDGRARVMRLYIDARAYGEVALQVGFEGIVDENNWLGRSQWVQDWYFPGRYEEFRLYSGALGASEITRLYNAGPDAL